MSPKTCLFVVHTLLLIGFCVLGSALPTEHHTSPETETTTSTKVVENITLEESTTTVHMLAENEATEELNNETVLTTAADGFTNATLSYEDDVSINATAFATEITSTQIASELNTTEPSTDRKEKRLSLDDIKDGLKALQTSCVCVPLRMMTFDSSTCIGHRVVTDPACECRKKCAQQSGQPCSDADLCDSEFGLACDKHTNMCQGKLQVQRSEVTHNSIVLRWKPSRTEELPQATVMYTVFYNRSNTRWMEAEPKDSMVKIDGLQPNTEYFIRVEENGHYEVAVVRTKDGCVVNGTLSFGEGEAFNAGCQQRCVCYRSGKTECRQRCNFLPGSVRDPSCEEVPDKNDPCCVTYQCKGNPVPSTPIVLVTRRTPSSLTIAWDDFKLPNYDSGYVVEYRALREDGKEMDWIPVQGGNIPWMAVNRLKPHTPYQVRVSVWDDIESRKLGTSSEVVTIYTEDGCVRNNQTFHIGEEFYEGCDLRCVCKGNDEGSCKERCSPPLTRAGAEPKEPHCFEVPTGDDPCCVRIQCAELKGNDPDTEALSFAEKPGLCPGQVETGDSDDCPTNCHHDQQCAGSMKCCQSSCGGSLCVEPFLSRNACTHVACGPNALCMHTEERPTCVCFPGFSGDPTDLNKGCIKDGATGRSIEVCTYNNATYNPGDIFFEGCKYRCICSQKLEVECVNRCPFKINEENVNETMCEIIAHRNDPCCKVPACESMINIVDNASNAHTSLETRLGNETSSSNDLYEASISTERSREGSLSEQMTTTLPPEGRMMTENLVAADFSSSVEPPITSSPEGKAFQHVHSQTDSNNMFEDPVTETALLSSPKDTLSPDEPHSTDSKNMMLDTESNMTHKKDMSGEEKIENIPPKKGIPTRFSGCEHNNKSYGLGESFEDGCEARCMCDGRGLISCVPRCPPLTESGARCREVPDPSDLCCRVVLCDVLGDRDTVHSPAGLAIRLESAQPQNASSIVIRIKLVAPAPPSDIIQVWYAPFEDNINADKPVTWTKQKFALGQLKLLEPYVVEAEVSGLRPSTEYYVKVVKPGMDPVTPAIFSNTVSVKTFPSVVKTAFKGCFHHNKTYDVGEAFYDGCDYRCLCHENGLLECRERCDVYEDTVGLEHCQWVPAPDDACCTIPYCGETIPRSPLRPLSEDSHFPAQDAFCVVNQGELKPLGAKWEMSNGCRQQTCTCALLPNGTTTVECQSGCPPLLNQNPRPDCPQPMIITPEDPCLCPYVTCSNSVNPPSVRGPMCEFKNQHYHVGEEFYDGCRAVCHCGRDLRVNCAAIECPQHFPSHLSECLEWEEDPNFVPNPPNCCAQPRCKSDGSCMVNGQKFRNYQPISEDLIDCSSHCVCVQGNVTCESRCLPISDSPPSNLPCLPQMAYQGHLPGDTCCLHWMCRQQEKGGKDLQNVNIISINSTTIRVRFTLPSMLVGLMGHAELHFTTDPSVDRTAWHVQKFARPKRMFDTANIEYYMSGLRPDTTYFFQVFIIVEALHRGPESEVFKLRMPSIPTSTSTSTSTALPVSTEPSTTSPITESVTPTSMKTTSPPTTTTTVTTTTYPPMLMIDPALSISEIQPTSAKVSWRMFNANEKRFIDGYKLKYKVASEKDSEWMMTPMIHRDVTSYILRDLKPGLSYMMDLQFVTSEGIPTHLVSTSPMEMRTADPPKDEYDFHVKLKKEKIGPYASDITLEGVPQPQSKYVHVVRATYKTDSDADQMIVFKVPKNSKITLENLKPGRRYKVWLDLYLTNGKILSADVVEFLTKAAPPEIQAKSDPSENSAEALQITHHNTESEAYYVALIVVAIVASVAGVGFIIVLIILMRKQSSAKAPITRSPSESAYDNPTYKTYDGERIEDKNGTVQA